MLNSDIGVEYIANSTYMNKVFNPLCATHTDYISSTGTISADSTQCEGQGAIF